LTVTANAQNTLQHFQEGQVPPLPMPAGTHASDAVQIAGYRLLCYHYRYGNRI